MPSKIHSSPKPYDQLDHGSIAKILRECLQKMHEKIGPDKKQTTYQDIANRINKFGEQTSEPNIKISEEAIRTFVNRDYILRYNSNNKTVKALYLYYMSALDTIDDDIKSVITDQNNWSVLNGYGVEDIFRTEIKNAHNALLSARSFYSWFHFDNTEFSRMLMKFANQYVLLRKSVNDKSMIVKSSLKISLDENKKILQAVHTHVDRQGTVRKPEGFVISVVRNIYIFLQVEGGEALEIIALKEPIQAEFQKMMGFMLSVNIDRKILSSRVFIEREDDIWNNIKPRFFLHDLENHKDRQELATSLLDKETSLTIPDVILTQAFE